MSSHDKKAIMDKIADLERFINNTVLKWIDLAEQTVQEA